MKKLLFFLGFATLILFSCSGDDSGSGFSSNITVNGQVFKPSVTDGSRKAAELHEYTSASGEEQARSFVLTRIQSNISGSLTLAVTITFPLSQTEFEGTYDLSDQSGSAVTASCLFTINEINYFAAESGFVTVTHLSGNKYRLEFDNVFAPGSIADFDKLIDGSGEGNFTVVVH